MVGVLHDVELVVDDLALAGPLLDAESKRLPHIHTGGLDPPPLPGTERLEEFVQALFLPFALQPQRFTRLQIAHHR